MMEEIIFLLDPAYRTYLLLATLLVYGLLLVRLWRSKAAWKPSRTLLLTAAIGSLFLAGLRPAVLLEEASIDLIYLTKNFQKYQLDSLVALHPQARVFTQEKTAGKEQIDISQLLENTPQLAALHILGDGVFGYELDFLKEREVYFYLNEYPEGIQKFAYNQVLRQGELLSITGIYHQKDTVPSKLTLVGPAGNLVSKTFAKKGSQRFLFQVEAEHAGRFLYKIIVEKAEDITEEKFPVLIQKNPAYATLVLQSTPSFETKYLKNWLGDEGRPVAVRSSITKGKFKTEFINKKVLDLNQITPSLLRQFELLVADEGLIEGLGKEEKNNLDQAIRQGLGLLVLPLSQPKAKAGLYQFTLYPTGKKTANWISGNGKSTQLGSHPFAIRQQAGKHPLIEAKDGRILAAYQHKGAGRIALSLLDETFQLQLKGETTAYQQVWIKLLEGCLAPNWLSNDWLLEDPLAVFPKEAIEIALITGEKHPKLLFGKEVTNDKQETVACPPAQAPHFPEMWRSQAWPVEAGWHFFTTKKHPEEKKWLYVQEKGAWNTLVRSRKITTNKQWFTKHSNENTTKPQLAKNKQWPLPLYCFYLAFLLFVGMIWLLEKIG